MTNTHTRHTGIISIVILVVTMITSCSEYSKVVKGNDYEKKYEFAMMYQEKGECYKALPLFEELMTYHRSTAKSEDIYYYYAYNHYCLKDYYFAAYYFKNFTKKFPYSSRAEECTYMTALCSFENAPDYNLDPLETKKAIDEFQLFMDKYPKSERIDTCNYYIKILRGRLEKKFYEQCKMYYKMERYNAAAISFTSFLQSYPDTQYREESMFLIIKSNYIYATNSVEDKKKERFETTIKSYHNFAGYFPESSYLKSAKDYFEQSSKAITKLLETQ